MTFMPLNLAVTTPADNQMAPASRQRPGAWPDLLRRSDMGKRTQNKFVTNNQWTTRGMTVAERFWPKVNKTESCWLWLAAVTDGYGMFWLDRRYQKAHRVAYEMLVGPIPEGLQLDHLCRVRNCVNPAHLEPVTALVNQQRGVGTFADTHGKKTHCVHGHEFTADNTYWFTNSRGFRGRMCKACCRDRDRAKRGKS
jgi:hypothetical protein